MPWLPPQGYGAHNTSEKLEKLEKVGPFLKFLKDPANQSVRISHEWREDSNVLNESFWDALGVEIEAKQVSDFAQ